MKQAIAAIVLFAGLTAPLCAEKFEGYLIDEMCSVKVLKAGGDAAMKHTKKCALMPNCKSSGYGIVTADGKFLKFDDDGDDMAVTMFGMPSANEDNIKVTVNGTLEGDTISVIAIQFL